MIAALIGETFFSMASLCDVARCGGGTGLKARALGVNPRLGGGGRNRTGINGIAIRFSAQAIPLPNDCAFYVSRPTRVTRRGGLHRHARLAGLVDLNAGRGATPSFQDGACVMLRVAGAGFAPASPAYEASEFTTSLPRHVERGPVATPAPGLNCGPSTFAMLSRRVPNPLGLRGSPGLHALRVCFPRRRARGVHPRLLGVITICRASNASPSQTRDSRLGCTARKRQGAYNPRPIIPPDTRNLSHMQQLIRFFPEHQLQAIRRECTQPGIFLTISRSARSRATSICRRVSP